MSHLLEVDNLHTVFETAGGDVKAVSGVSFHLDRGETLGVVGESGCGKSVTALSLMRLLDHPGRIVSGSVRLNERDLVSLPAREMEQIRGNEISMIFQDPLTSMNPAYRIGWQLAEPLRLHRSKSRREASAEAVTMLRKVGIPDGERRSHDYPHQFSGGMRQRAMIAMGLTTTPSVLIADEPTTALDVTVQAQILQLLRQLNQEFGMAIILITHNLGVVAGMCDRLNVMYAGRIVETGRTDAVFADPKHPYTALLLRSTPRIDLEGDRRLVPIAGAPPDLANLPQGCSFADRCPLVFDRCRQEAPPLAPVNGSNRLAACWLTLGGQPIELRESEQTRQKTSLAAGEPLLDVKGLATWFPVSTGIGQRKSEYRRAVDGVDISIARGETLGLVGETGCGKTTLGRTIVRLIDPHGGQILFKGSDLTSLRKRQLRGARREMAMIFQDPYASLNPRHTVAEIVGEPLDVHRLARGAARRARIHELLDLVGLDASHASRYPHEFSGGQRQRIGIARALAAEPELIICDEPTSALDVSIQAQLIRLLEDLQTKLDLTYLFISHDLAMVKYIASRVAVMYMGRIVETGPVDAIFERPRHPYTAALVDAVPVPDPVIESKREHLILEGDLPYLSLDPVGCRFRERCFNAQAKCATDDPPLLKMGSGTDAACWFPMPEDGS